MSDGNALLAKADKTLSGAKGGFSFFGNREQKLEDAADLYTQAANAFRIDKNGEQAARCFEKAASIQSDSLSQPIDAATSLTEASKAYRKVSPPDAVRTLEKAVGIFTRQGNFRRAATYQQTVGEIYEQDLGDFNKAIDAYSTAAGWYDEDNAQALANKWYLKAAELSAVNASDYYKAIELFEKVAKQAVQNNLTRYSVKNYLLQAGLCHLATNDIVGAKRAIESYTELDPSFGRERERQLLADLTEAVELNNAETFQDKTYQFDRMSPLDSWKTSMLLR
ncbi:TPR-like protein [Aulographum hederae CBS 113979]|uniref:TPR-like protein n=1 Tax=Aulographum hederae CBS 113979 TaxID=1176131 RepID=A0A6G1HEI0_9PEZI|nr:TPR-like protein [Aulographum hederae CBS 113979]